MERQGNAANPARFLRPLHVAVEKHVAYRTENGALRPPERNACRQRLQRLEVGASLAFILARVAAWARNIIRRWPQAASACDVVRCAGFWTPGCRHYPRALAAGVQKAPRHEIA